MDNFFKDIFNAVGKQYEVLVYERARLKTVAAQRDVLKLGHLEDGDRDARLTKKIQLTETILTALAELKDLSNE